MGEQARAGKVVVPIVAIGAVCIFALAQWLQSQAGGRVGRRGKSHQSSLGLRHARLTAAERRLATHIMDPEQVQKLSEDDIIGHQHIVKQLRRTIGISLRGAGRSSVLSQGRGFLISGPPGTGKTTIAELAAQQSNCNLLRISPDLLRDKLYGESEKTVAAIFSLSRKLWECSKKPTIVFMDEVDTILGDASEGSGSEHEASRTARALFAQKWDGIEAHPGLIIFGTTNHENKLPHYIYRRFSSRFTVGLPSPSHRRLIFKRFITTAAVELVDLWGDDAPAAAAAPDVAEALSRFVEAELLSDSARAAPPLPAAELQRLTAALEAVLHPSVPVQDILSSPCMPPLERLARLTHGYAGSDIRDVVHHGTPQDEEMDKITYESLLQGLTKVIATENRQRSAQGGATKRAVQSIAELPAIEEPAVTRAAVRPLGDTASVRAEVDSALLPLIMHYYPVVRIVMLSVLLSMTAKISGNMDAMRVSMQSKDAPQ